MNNNYPKYFYYSTDTESPWQYLCFSDETTLIWFNSFQKTWKEPIAACGQKRWKCSNFIAEGFEQFTESEIIGIVGCLPKEAKALNKKTLKDKPATKFKVGDKVTARDLKNRVGTVMVVLPIGYDLIYTTIQSYLIRFDDFIDMYIDGSPRQVRSCVKREGDLELVRPDYYICGHKVTKHDNKVFVGCQEINKQWIKCAQIILNNDGKIEMNGTKLVQNDIDYLSKLLAI